MGTFLKYTVHATEAYQVGIKAFTLADAANGFMLNSLVYTSAQTLDHADPAYNLLPQPACVVMDLMGQYLDKGCHVFTDRYVYGI